MRDVNYLAFLLRRLRACLDTTAFPYERLVCLWAFHLQLVFILVPAIAWWAGTAWLPEQYGVLGWGWRLYCAWGAGWLGGFVWADLGPEERYRELAVGTPVNSNVFATNTLEDYVGAKRGGYQEDDEIMAIFHRMKWLVNLQWEQSGQPRYDWQADPLYADTRTWAQRLHYRHVRPWLIARGVPGYGVSA